MSFLNNSNNIENVSYTLIERNSTFLWIPFIVFLSCLVILSIIRQFSPSFLLFYLRYYKSPSQLNKLIREDFDLGSLSSFLLIFLFFINSSMMIFMSFDKKLYFNNEFVKYGILFFSIILYLWNVGSLKFFSWITDNKKKLNEYIKTIIVNKQFVGIIQSILLLFWIFNIKKYNDFIMIFIYIQFAMWLFIIIRCIILSIKNSFSWYYIILYLCTLELLPIYLFYLTITRLNLVKY